MTAKEYLQNCHRLKIQMENKKRSYDSIRKSITYLQGVAYERDRVQTSPTDALSNTMAKLVDAEREAMDAIWEYESVYSECMKRINSLSKYEYIRILMLRYFSDDYEARKFESIALDIAYSYVRTCHLHGEALREFEEKFLKNEKS